MRRRDFLRTFLAIAPVIASRRVLPQGHGPVRRAAIVIGVNKSGNLPVLRAAVSGAQAVAGWLRGEGFEVKEFLDEDELVTVGGIYDAVERLIDRGTLEQLVVYFSGHGFNVGYSEHWFLSKAPRNPNESILLRESVEGARASAIPNVVFISDACRSTSDSLGVQRVHGSLIFPSGRGGGDVDIDQFFAALPGEYALELPLRESVDNFEGIYTAAFLDAYKYPDSTMVKAPNGVPVVPNRLLKDYLVREVRKRAEAKSIKLRQLPESRVESDDKTYIGRVTVSPPLRAVAPKPSVTIADVASVELRRAGVGPSRTGPGLTAEERESVAGITGFDTTLNTIIQASRASVRDQFETKTGFIVFGARVEFVTTRPSMLAQVVSRGEAGQPATLRLAPVPGSAIILFANGSGIVVANLPGYIGTVIVKDGGVISVSYAPSRNDWRWDQYNQERSRLNQLRAAVATAVQFGVFRIEGDRETRIGKSAELANSIRILKGVDPTLGLYAAYAYADANLIDELRSVHSIMRDDLGTALFDIAMLAGTLAGRNWESLDRIVPFCPLLNQGWSLLRVKGVRLPGFLEEARSDLHPALWTTFGPKGMRTILENSGR